MSLPLCLPPVVEALVQLLFLAIPTMRLLFLAIPKDNFVTVSERFPSTVPGL